jgi:hypothetical protein
MIDLNPDQLREMVNTRQRFAALQDAFERQKAFRGSMVWSPTKGTDYLLHATYHPDGKRRQKSLGPRSDKTERIKDEFDRGRSKAQERWDEISDVLKRQAAVNRALGLGRVPRLAARILRALDATGLMGHGLRLVGTYALYAYEAQAGVFFDAGLTTTEDLDLLFDSRARLRILSDGEVTDDALISVLSRVDRSFERTRERFRARNSEGFLVDLIRPLRNPPWKEERDTIGDDGSDLEAVAIEGLVWLENAEPFEAIAIDERGEPVRLPTVDPRAFAAHKLWVSQQAGRDPLQRRRDALQAQAVARLTIERFPHLPYEAEALRNLSRPIFDAARPLFHP